MSTNNNDPKAGGPGAQGQSAHPLDQYAVQPQSSNDNGEQSPYYKSQVPAISLPKGGGALKGIDEKFSVNAINGTASLQVALPLSPGRSGFTPALSLSYNSGSGNSEFGLGWGLGLPVIQRKTDKKLPEYNDAAESDVFLLAGAEDLVPVQKDDGSVYEETVTDANSDVYHIKRYRPRIEGLFARIELISRPGSTHKWWRVTTKDNMVTYYGLNTDGCIIDPSDDTRIFKWLPQLSIDNRGNVQEFVYAAENKDNVMLSAHEANRLNDLSLFTNKYLKKVRYCNKNPYFIALTSIWNGYLITGNSPYKPILPPNPEYLMEAVFDYGDHSGDFPSYDPDQDWLCRKDAFSDFHAGFEIRTYRKCRRVLMFHCFRELNDDNMIRPVLVRSLDITYLHDNTGDDFAEADLITQATQTGYRRKPDNTGWYKRSLPPMVIDYQPLAWDTTIHTVSEDDAVHAPQGLTGSYQWMDLYGEGISGILTEQSGAWYYKSNLGDGHFTPAMLVAEKPSFAGLGTAMQWQDLDADGRRQLVSHDPAMQGYFELDDENEWQPFRNFKETANIDWNSPYTKMLDLDGDGRPDLLLTEDRAWTWYKNKGTQGISQGGQVTAVLDEERGPRLVLNDTIQRIFLADMNGDGMTDIVRIMNGEICYWPNKGWGRFGAKVTMSNAPVFTTPDMYDPQYLHLADISGTGALDLLYRNADGSITAWINQAGNAWSLPVSLGTIPSTEQEGVISVLDFLGNGTGCIVWSSPLPQYAGAALRYMDLMGGNKPYIMRGYHNSMGKSVWLEYKSSTKFYLADKAAGTPWATKLPFPVQCLERVTTTDAVSETSYSQRYSYHHGYYDHEEREFRGFGRVDAVDIDGPLPVTGDGGAEDIIPHQDPVLTKTWYHTGAWLREQTLLDAYEAEYYPFEGNRILTCTIENGQTLSPRELREAYRALKGAALRQEVYALDGSDKEDKPYAVSATAYTIRLLQHAADTTDKPVVNGYAVFFSFRQQSLSWGTERNPDDARIAHSIALNVDMYGNVLESASVVYPRTVIPSSLPQVVQGEQAKMHVSYSVNSMARFTSQGSIPAADCDIAGHYRLRIPCESKAYEVTGLDIPEDGYWQPDALHTACQAATVIDFSATASGSVAEKKLLSCSRIQYYLSGSIGNFGYYDIDALMYRQYSLAFTDDVLAAGFGTKVSDNMLTEGGYRRSADIPGFPAGDPADRVWLRSGVAGYGNPPEYFMQPYSFGDAFDQYAGGIGFWSDYYLMPYRVWDGMFNYTYALAYDWYTLQPTQMMDLNSNITEICYDVLGMPVAMAVKGKGNEADYLLNSTGGAVDADSSADIALQAGFWDDPEASAKALLGRATWRCVYNLESQPTAVAMIAREEHYVANSNSNVLIRLSYSDGFGRVAMHKAQATDDPDTHAVRWIAGGKTIYNNKGSVVMQFEPYYSATHAYDPAVQAANLGISPRIHYDPLGRAFRTDMPDGTYSYTTWDGWSQTVYDANDSVLNSDWYAARQGSGVTAEEQDAAAKAASHAGTPAVVHLDSLGRAFYTIQHNRTPDSSGVWQDEYIHSHAVLDIQGDRLAVVDGMVIDTMTGERRTQLQYKYSQLKAPLWQQSIDGGEGRVLLNAAGQPYYSWDTYDRRFHITYDLLQRPLRKEVRASGVTKVLERTYYGEGSGGNNLCGRAILQYDASGISYIDQCYFNGVPWHSYKQYTADAQSDADWTDVNSVALETELYSSVVTIDALGRPTSQRTDIVSTSWTSSSTIQYDSRFGRNLAVLHSDTGTTQTTYDKAGVAITTGVSNLRGQNKNVVTGMKYNAKGQTEAVWYGNGTKTGYTYDPQNYRVRRILTVHLATNDILQDLNYWYDAVGNITQLQDDAQQTLFYNNSVVTPDQLFTYDALYRLVKAEGREQKGLATFGSTDNWDDAAWKTSHKGDGGGVQRYTQKYRYDAAGNILELKHVAGSGSYTRTYDYESGSNRLQTTTVGTDTYSYSHDTHGNMTGMPHLVSTAWNVLNEMSSVSTGTTTAYYQYSGGGRVRKYIKKTGGTEVRLYLGNFEIYRKFDNSSSLILERTTLHTGVAIYEERTYGSDDSPEHLARFSYSNHLGSAALELDESAAIISYEEYHPYGTTSYQAMNASINATAKRYRYTGKERDEESGLYYHGARYYACWLARWTAVDPLEGKYAPQSCYVYCSNNPVMRHDPDGRGDKERRMMSAAAGVSLAVSGNPVMGASTMANTKSPFPKQIPLTKIGGSVVDNVGVGGTSPGIRTPEQQQLMQDAKEKAAAHERYMNEETMIEDVYGNTHVGKRRNVQNTVWNTNTEHSNEVGERVATNLIGSQAYAISGGDERYLNAFSVFDAWAMYKSGYTNAAAGNVIPARPAIEPATTPATAAPAAPPPAQPESAGTMGRTAEGTYAITLTPQKAAEVNPAYSTPAVKFPAPSLPTTGAKIIIIGEGQVAVEKFAKTMEGARTIMKDWPNEIKFNPYVPEKHEEVSLEFNRQWINAAMDAGYMIYDIGPKEDQINSKFYGLEIQEIIGRNYQNYYNLKDAGRYERH